MRNEEKYRTTDERIRAFWRFCKGQEKKRGCLGCPTKGVPPYREKCALTWLALEAKEQLLPCPFCGGEACVGEACVVEYSGTKHAYIRCKDCMAITQVYNTEDEAIAAWNRRTK